MLFRPTLRWTRLTQLVSLNTPGYANGVLILYANDTLALAQTGIVYRTSEDVTLKNVLFSTFFGGSDNTWDSTGGDAYFRSFAVSSPSPPSCQIPVRRNLNWPCSAGLVRPRLVQHDRSSRQRHLFFFQQRRVRRFFDFLPFADFTY